MSFSHKFERNDFIVSLWNGYHMLKLEILLHLSKKKKKKNQITTTPQLKEQTQFVIFSPGQCGQPIHMGLAKLK